MDTLELDLYRKDFNVVANHSCLGRILRTIVLLSIVFSIPFFSPVSNGAGQFIGIMLILGGMFVADRYIRRLYPDWPNKKNFVGKLILDEQKISIIQESRIIHKIDDCLELVMFYNFFAGYVANHRDIQQNGNGLLFFKNKNKEVFVYKFNIKNKKSYASFLELIKHYKESIPYFKEYVPEEIGHILNVDLSNRIIYKKYN